MTKRDELIWSQEVDESNFEGAKVMEATHGASLTINDELLALGYRFGLGENIAGEARVLRNKIEGQLRAGQLRDDDPDTLSVIHYLEYFMDFEPLPKD